jgi:TonB family protein
VIHFDFYDRYENENVVGHAINRRDGVLLSVVFHALVIAAFTYGPQLTLLFLRPEEVEQRRVQREDDLERTFVFVEPKLDLQTLQPRERAPLSDADRLAMAPEIAPEPENPEPAALGNTPEKVVEEATPPPERARGDDAPQPQPETQVARADPPALTLPTRPVPPPRAAGSLGDALRNLQRYVQNQRFDNPQGGTDRPGAEIQFDTKGVEFGPWIRRFVAQVRRNWFIPQAAMIMSGRVVLQFNIHKDGRITDLSVAQPSHIDAFTNAAYNAILTSNPTEPLPPEYPSPQAFFTVTFYYNEQPPIR